MRIYKTIKDALNETFRDLQVRGCTVECKSYQDKKLEGEDRYVKELMGVAFKIDKPTLNLKECIEYVFGEDSERIIKYCEQEIEDRCSGKPLNPGNSYKIRKDMWSQFLENNSRFCNILNKRHRLRCRFSCFLKYFTAFVRKTS